MSLEELSRRSVMAAAARSHRATPRRGTT